MIKREETNAGIAYTDDARADAKGTGRPHTPSHPALEVSNLGTLFTLLGAWKDRGGKTIIVRAQK